MYVCTIHILMRGPRHWAVSEGSTVRMMMVLVYAAALWVVLAGFVCNVCVCGHVHIHTHVLYLCESCAHRNRSSAPLLAGPGPGAAAASPL